ncbi:hypothetical protein QBC35DRAFT_107592 [Podospora australis]|uniref:Uncharacterized protein n=1 Tax=Podospora australis TaxID=1536484 RepID=A0AAN7ALT8_9PEZI|nr:hypothetical protein QBC35DRAFT_107592 [Podospora australis]
MNGSRDEYGRDDYGVAVNKQWANDYIFGPLNEPEPSQVFATRFTPKRPPSPPQSPTPKRRPSFLSRHSKKSSYTEGDDVEQPILRRLLSRTGSVRSVRSIRSIRSNKQLPPSPPQATSPPAFGLERKKSVHTANPLETRWNQGTILSRANSVASSRPRTEGMASTTPHRRNLSLTERYPGDKSHRPLEMLMQHRQESDDEDVTNNNYTTLPKRTGSLRARYPGDMSHRPLAMLTQEHRAADRAPHLHNKHHKQPSDTIDTLDDSAPLKNPTYHHEGPFDATMPARNVNNKLAPMDAVKETNLEAIKATPVEYLQDSLVKHVPLQGTAVVPPGMTDMGGRMMDYEEGADLMREPEAGGGAYKRWDGVRYRDDDLKGKGEPEFSMDQDRKARGKQPASSLSGDGVLYYEMQPQKARSSAVDDKRQHGVRHRSVSINEGPSSSSPPLPAFVDEVGGGSGSSGGLQRSNTTGKSLTQSLKRRFGSLRRKKVPGEEGYY